MSKVRIEFFHDVICSFCFPMSYRMRELARQMPEAEIIHRSFALVREEGNFDHMFGSREAAKKRTGMSLMLCRTLFLSKAAILGIRM